MLSYSSYALNPGHVCVSRTLGCGYDAAGLPSSCHPSRHSTNPEAWLCEAQLCADVVAVVAAAGLLHTLSALQPGRGRTTLASLDRVDGGRRGIAASRQEPSIFNDLEAKLYLVCLRIVQNRPRAHTAAGVVGYDLVAAGGELEIERPVDGALVRVLRHPEQVVVAGVELDCVCVSLKLSLAEQDTSAVP